MIGGVSASVVAGIVAYSTGRIQRKRPAVVLAGSGNIPTDSGEITLVEYVVSLDKLGVHDVEHVGGKNASLGELYRELMPKGVPVPNGFAITAEGYRHVLDAANAWPAVPVCSIRTH